LFVVWVINGTGSVGVRDTAVLMGEKREFVWESPALYQVTVTKELCKRLQWV